MSVIRYCNPDVVFITAQNTIQEAVELMHYRHVGALVVEQRPEGNIPIGMLTDRDIVIEVLAEGVSIDSVTVGDIMSSELKTVSEDEEVAGAIRLMCRLGVRRLPVVDAKNTLRGLITLDDLIRLEAEKIADLAGLIGREQRQERKRRP